MKSHAGESKKRARRFAQLTKSGEVLDKEELAKKKHLLSCGHEIM